MGPKRALSLSLALALALTLSLSLSLTLTFKASTQGQRGGLSTLKTGKDGKMVG